MNSIVNLKTVNADSAEGPLVAVVMGLDIGDLASADAFVQEAAEKFKQQRMCSPPTTNAMLITLVSEMPASRFVQRWRQIASEDKILGFFMSQMKKADVLRGKVAGEALETVSLMDAPAA